VVINAGNASCATDREAVALATCKAAAKLLRLGESGAAVPTGVIGMELDPRKIVEALPKLVKALRADSFANVSRAIMTTDLVPRAAFAEARLRRGPVRVAGMTRAAA
jgi:glutamate N-acetyltransferase/amino-acid N-acetyltransferase